MKRLDALIATQKTRTHFNGIFLKEKDLNVKNVQKKLDPHCSFSRFFSKLFMIIRFLKAYMKCLDPLSAIIQKLALF